MKTKTRRGRPRFPVPRKAVTIRLPVQLENKLRDQYLEREGITWNEFLVQKLKRSRS